MAETIAIPLLSGLARVFMAIASGAGSLERERKAVVADLRVFRFGNDGILPVLDSLLGDAKIDDNWLRARLVDFNDREWAVVNAASRLAEDADGLPGISHMMRQELDLLRWRKIDLRKELQEIINPYFLPRRKVDMAELSRVRDGIADLNRAIDEAEHILLHSN